MSLIIVLASCWQPKISTARSLCNFSGPLTQSAGRPFLCRHRPSHQPPSEDSRPTKSRVYAVDRASSQRRYTPAQERSDRDRRAGSHRRHERSRSRSPGRRHASRDHHRDSHNRRHNDRPHDQHDNRRHDRHHSSARLDSRQRDNRDRAAQQEARAEEYRRRWASNSARDKAHDANRAAADERDERLHKDAASKQQGGSDQQPVVQCPDEGWIIRCRWATFHAWRVCYTKLNAIWEHDNKCQFVAAVPMVQLILFLHLPYKMASER